MYAAHFGLRELPFNNTPDPRFFHATSDHEEAMACQIYAIQHFKGFVLLTGEVGTGKTLVTRMVLRHFSDRIVSGVIHNTQLAADELVGAVCTEFGVDVPDNRLAQLTALQDFLLKQFAGNRQAVLILDEAQNLSDEAFEQLRMIGNLEADDAKLLQIMIVGQPELRERFRAHHMRPLRQRLFRSFHLAALSPEQCVDYVEHRLRVAGWPDAQNSADAGPLFDEQAQAAIYEFSGGLPRLINTACDNALLSAYSADRRFIDGPFMRHVIDHLGVADDPEWTQQPSASNIHKGSLDTAIDVRPESIGGPSAGQTAPPLTANECQVATLPGTAPADLAGVLDQARSLVDRLVELKSADLGQSPSRPLIHHLADIQRPASRIGGMDRAAGGERLGDTPRTADPASPAERLRKLLEEGRSNLQGLRRLAKEARPQRPVSDEQSAAVCTSK